MVRRQSSTPSPAKSAKRARDRARRGMERNADPETKARVKVVRKGPCDVPWCKNPAIIEVDHIVPLASGGQHHSSNLHPLCRKHNRQKGTKPWGQFLAEIRDKG